ncbi:host cell division inhibitor Icd-like protein [Salmonella enterica]|nr:host cell division inhibitor Icd-like protein [Salmonella enterica]EJS3015134.1 host cell division inhibitor Icd-like protein [Salmonella enterica]EJS3017809.1 host cell division inhibitor Icd-like protein [Salmonella enterica]
MAWCAIHPQGLRCLPDGFLSHHAAHDGAVSGCCVRLTPVIDAQNRTPRRPVMVALTGQPQGWPVSLYAGTANPVNVTAPIKICSLSGDSLNLYKEDAVMVATPTQTPPEFIWRFWSCQQSRYITSTATSEHEACAMLPASSSRPVFAARIRLEVRHV